jgi:hypothetical protein
LPFEYAEIGGVAQIIALPGVAIKDEPVEFGIHHAHNKTRATIFRDHAPSRVGMAVRQLLKCFRSAGKE